MMRFEHGTVCDAKRQMVINALQEDSNLPNIKLEGIVEEEFGTGLPGRMIVEARKALDLPVFVRPDKKQSKGYHRVMKKRNFVLLKKTKESIKARRCSKCGRVLSIEQFYLSNGRHYRGDCKDCRSEYNKLYHQRRANKIFKNGFSTLKIKSTKRNGVFEVEFMQPYTRIQSLKKMVEDLIRFGGSIVASQQKGKQCVSYRKSVRIG